jgi:Uma2 family endonuclease
MSAHAQPRLTPEQYLELDRASEVRNEFYDGAMYAMSGGSRAHNLVVGNLQGLLWSALRGRLCASTPTDTRVQISASSYVYPDVVIVCGPPQTKDSKVDVLLNPSIVIEVLSPSTERHDRGMKSALYRSIATLREYALVSQDEPRVEIFRRQPNGEWVLSESVGLESACAFQGVEGEPVRIPLREIYERVTFPDPEATLPTSPIEL